MKCEAYKTRFTQPFQNVTIEVPYETGMDPYNGLYDVAVELGIIEQKGAWYSMGEHKWQGQKKFPVELYPVILKECESRREKYLDAIIEAEELDLTDGPSSKKRRQAKVEKK